MIGHEKGRLGPSLVMFAALVVAIGCSGSSDNLPREAVSGTVTLDGQPLASGSISFNPPANAGEGMTGGGSQIQNGKFSIPRDMGLVPGNYNVAIYASNKAEQTRPAQVGAGNPKNRAKDLIPAKYNTNTELKYEIKKGGGNDLTFTLESKK
jgi:hypothetical protein